MASPAVADNPALGSSVTDLMRDAMSDPAGFQKRMREQAGRYPPVTGLEA